MRLIDADELKKALNSHWFIDAKWANDCIDNAPTIIWCSETSEGLPLMDLRPRPQGEWFDCIETGTLKARHGDYVLYKVDFLLDNLTREVYIMEGARRMRGE